MKKYILPYLYASPSFILIVLLTSCGGLTLDDDVFMPDASGIGANVPFVTYEAEEAFFSGELLIRDTTYNELQSEASGRMAVRLQNPGDFVSFTLTRPANAMVVRFSMPDAPLGGGMEGSLAVYAGSVRLDDLLLTSRYSWIYNIAGYRAWPGSKNPADGPPSRFFNDSRMLLGQTWPAGTEITLKKKADTIEWYVIDMAEFEVAPPPLARPPHSLCITEFGAVANDGSCSRAALNSALNAGRNQNRRVWIPEGTFTVSGDDNIHVTGAVVSGAGIWHSTLSGGAFFFVNGSSNHFHDFAIFGNVTRRVDADRHCAFEVFPGSNNRFENLWIENVKCGFWVKGNVNLVIRNSRIRNTFADGINLTGNTRNSIVEHNDMRNHGDDAIALNSENNQNTTGNIVRNNTIRLPYHASGIAVYGGGNNFILNNLIFDTVAFGGGINISSRFQPTPFSGTTTVSGNKLVRTGSYRSERGRNQGAIWLVAWDANVTGIVISGNHLIDSLYDGISIDGMGGRSFSNIQVQNNSIERAGRFGIRIFNGAAGSASFSNVSVIDAASGGLHNGSGGNFTVTRLGGNSGW